MFAKFARESAERRLVVGVGVGFQRVAGRVGVLGQLAAVAAGGAGDLLGEPAGGVLDRDDMRGAQHPEQQRTAVGMVGAGSWPVAAVRAR